MKLQKARSIVNQEKAAQERLADAKARRARFEAERDTFQAEPQRLLGLANSLLAEAAEITKAIAALEAKRQDCFRRAKLLGAQADEHPTWDESKLTAACKDIFVAERDLAKWSKDLNAARERIAEIEKIEADYKAEHAMLVEQYKQQALADKNLTDDDRAKIDYAKMADKFIENKGKTSAGALGGKLLQGSPLPAPSIDL